MKSTKLIDQNKADCEEEKQPKRKSKLKKKEIEPREEDRS
jgi:hypothetical protein